MLEKELTTAIAIAREAGDLILEHYKRDIVAEEKIGADNFAEPVTIADRDSSGLILSRLANAFPGDSFLSEEAVDDVALRLSRERTWIIDPIDGTAGFIKKDGDFSVHIGLADRGGVIAGVVFIPSRDILFSAAKGSGAFVTRLGSDPVRLRVTDKTKFEEMTLALTKNHYSGKMAAIIDGFGFAANVRRGSVGLKVGLIAERECDIYIHPSPRTKLWDTCAPQIILEEAGGRLTDLFGEPIRYDIADVQNHDGILATNGASHDAAVRHLRPILDRLDRVQFVSN